MTSVKDRALGSILGLAVGDALGAPVEFKAPGSFPKVTGYRDGGPFHLLAGQWTDDTSMAMCLAEALMVDPKLAKAKSVTERWIRWMDDGYWSSTGKCFDIGGQTSAALIRWRDRNKGPTHTTAAGNGGIMRMAPAVVRWHANRACSVRVGIRQSSLTHNSQEAIEYAGMMAEDLWDLINGNVVSSHWLGVSKKTIKAGGSAGECYDAARWCLDNTNTFRSAVLTAANLGHDSDTVGAVTGQLAGAKYGMSGIPSEWLRGLHEVENILATSELLFAQG